MSRKWRWVTRNEDSACVYIWLGIKKPTKSMFIGWLQNQPPRGYIRVCVSEFKKIAGFTIEQGTCVKVEFSAKLVK